MQYVRVCVCAGVCLFASVSVSILYTYLRI